MTDPITKATIFDVLWKEADRLIRLYDPCQFKDGKCRIGAVNGCCTGGYDNGGQVASKKYRNRPICKYLDEDKGCTIQCLGCKTHLCCHDVEDAEIKAWGKLLGGLEMLRLIAQGLHIDIGYYLIKEEAVGKRDPRKEGQWKNY